MAGTRDEEAQGRGATRMPELPLFTRELVEREGLEPSTPAL
jgi:hypothetical protein